MPELERCSGCDRLMASYKLEGGLCFDCRNKPPAEKTTDKRKTRARDKRGRFA